MSPRALVLAAVGLGAACGSGSRPPLPAPATPHFGFCLIAGDSADPARRATVLFDDEADGKVTRRAAARLAPIRLDCEGRARPGLAQTWTADSTGAFWTLVLRPPRPDSADSAPRWTAAALAATWRADPEAAAALRLAGVTTTLPLDDRRLVVGLAPPSASLPRVFADRALAVAIGGAPGLEVSSPEGDLRDAVDRGPDVIVTADPDVLDYAGRHPLLRRFPLPWSRRYLLVLPQPVAGLVPADTNGFRAALARDAVRADARPVPAPDGSDSTAPCPRELGRPSAPVSGAVAYPAGDPTARELAERLVALAKGAVTVAQPLGPEPFAAAFARTEARAFVVRVPARGPSSCALERSWPGGAAVIPLVEVRAHAIVRPGAPALAVEWDAALRPAETADTEHSDRAEATP